MLTESQIRNLFARLNSDYFDNELPQPDKIEFKFVKGFLGQFHWDGLFHHRPFSTCSIRFSTAWQMTDFEVEKVLIHEMIHEWQWVKEYRTGHGSTFKNKAAYINRISNNRYEIARCTAIKNRECLKGANKGEYTGAIIRYERADYPGKILVACCKPDNLKKFKTWFPAVKNVSNIHFYLVKGEIYNRLSKSCKRVVGYQFTPSLYREKIETTIIKEI